MQDVYKNCPKFENEKYKLRLVSEDDCVDLLKVYSDLKAVPFFNSDNCCGDDFYYSTKERMKKAIEYWIFEYNRKGFVRWSVFDKERAEVVGTIELFRRDADDYFTGCGLLRLDIRSDYENEVAIKEILSLILLPTFELFKCNKIATKAIDKATERIKALEKIGFSRSREQLIGQDGTRYCSYFIFTL